MLETLYNIFQGYGIAGLLFVILAAILIIIGKHIVENMKGGINNGFESLTKNITRLLGEQNTQLIEAINTQNNKIIDYLINQNNEEKKLHDGNLSARMSVTLDINSMLKDILIKTNSSRVVIMEFHNSFQNLSGVPFAKYSCTFEQVDIGVRPIQDKWQAMPFSSISGVVEKMLKKPNTAYLEYINMDDFREDAPVIFALVDDLNVYKIMFIPLYNSNNVIIGGIAIEWHRDPKISINYNELIINTAKISSLLNFKVSVDN
jgi:hypothetical protein